ncbi:lipopolysaccharide biosynthesis protein [Pseudomonas sp. 6D_7.1_Bac1]|uniref:lipopolysaccharide biosynthesis protein n=1 Tax=Pseudomonas sp. 6D_7.1_Bac1 TaxID=2971615 RepID=UPI0021C95FF6|nr:lipopolysaccharide biosynthesis protein [Pseudomonas sp. 6D_7.1_Bac1]MCU1749229.1 lipopolysaccharide biosynthesis protein [Pseudomonas sp. 6D_7.1_Bac1]
MIDTKFSHVSEFNECHNIETGTVFIIASGSSAKDFPIDEFAHVPMITMNGAVALFEGTAIKPFFYVCTDMSFPTQQPELFSHAMQISQRVALWEEYIRRSDIRPQGQLFALKPAIKQSWFDSTFKRNKDLVRSTSLFGHRRKSIGFSKNLSDGFFDARTVAYLALQLAYHAGFTKVIMVGVDLNQSSGRFYETETSNKSPCALDQHFHTRILPSLKLMAEKVMNKNFSVYNLSKNSRIPDSVIPTISIQEVRAQLT